MIRELPRRTVGKQPNNVRLLRYNGYNCYASNINVLSKIFRCRSCDQFIKKAGSLKKHFTTCKERVKHIFLKNVYQLRRTLFDKLDSFGMPYTDNQTILNNMAAFDFELICVEDENLKVTETQHGLAITIQFPYQYRPTLQKNPFSSVILILVTWYRFSLTLWKIWLRQVKLNGQ